MKILVARLLGLLLFLAVSPALAEEYIQSYHSVIDVAPNSELTVTETIKVNSEGVTIRRGIFRDFPLYAENAEGRRTKVDFSIVSVERDGMPEDWHTESISGGVRIYTGSADRLLQPGEHTYQITYTTGRQIRYFDGYDELYWNVTGNGWQFRMAEISATVVLPDGVSPSETAVFTGAAGQASGDAQVMTEGNEVFFSSTRPYAEGEGMTIAVKLPKGAISPPSSGQESQWYLRDNAGYLLSFVGLIVIALYYLRAWFAVGRDPSKGVVVPRWDAPEGISPALVNYIDNNGFSGAGWIALSASALDLAVKGFVVLEDLKSSITIRRTDKKADPALPTGQKALLQSIGEPGAELRIDKANGKRVETVGSQFRQSIEKEHSGKYYHSNAGYTLFGVFLSIAFIVAVLVFGDLDEDVIAAAIIGMFFAVFFSIAATVIGKNLRDNSSLSKKIAGIVVGAFFAFSAISMFASIMSEMWFDLSHSAQFPIILALGGIALLNGLFIFLMGAPTPLGRKMMDGIEGLRIYLTLAEKDRMNMAGAPEMSPSHFEKLLPYAVALGVEKPWSRAFETWLATAAAGAAAATYAPSWYGGNYSGGFGDRIGGFSSSMASTIASTIPAPPKSSSSGFSSGGGSSGGGGGGGGGGGW
ncbi:DUF2207 domain-containing protein [Agrobacterium sp.]|uniref:DUF2207 domain-containing protein n=1 Tax=Agrobacterium sp. TaxID=361 RepID=UPI0028AD7590|nr:DUF2207 domain-containing protein [Agrobacterium sp.]